jgi:LysM repeat protein
MSDPAHGIGAPPRACPFVALEEDRDRRALAPDPRHRCYAVPTAQPRTLAHQGTYCLSSSFPSCTFFLEWAARAAADPLVAGVPVAVSRAESGLDSGSGDLLDPMGRPWATPPPWVAEPDLKTTRRSPPPNEQLSVFPDPSGDGLDYDMGLSHARPEPAKAPSASAVGAARPGGRPMVATPPPRIERQARPLSAKRTDSASAAGRTRRFEAYPTLGRRIRMRGISPLVVGIFALMIAALVLFLLPGFLSEQGGLADPSAEPSGSVAASVTQATPIPSATPQSHTVRRGEVLGGIAKSLGLTVDQIACFNGIKNANMLKIGQVLLIPPPDYTCPPKGGESSSKPRAAAS